MRSKNKILHLIFYHSLAYIFIFVAACKSPEATNLIFEIVESDTNPVRIKSVEIEKIGLNETMGSVVGVEIEISVKYHQKLKEITTQNIGKELRIRIASDIIFVGKIYQAAENGKFVLSYSDKEEALDVIKKFRRKPDYHLKFTEQEIENAKIYTEPAKNPFYEKSVYALTYKEYAKAEEFAIKAIESDPSEPSYYGHLAAIYYMQGNYESALKHSLKWEKAIRPEEISKYPGAYLSLGEIYIRLGDYENAITAYKKFLSVNQRNLNVHHGLAIAYEKAGQYKLSRQEYTYLLQSQSEYFEKIGLDGIKRLNNKK
ncbi:hypothetical protein D1BOALGB6SA_1363 [Olavius sp. associated proteobacterium Delta 1]|nr:hypothetical protein D1BOALGB6SA_1363 [Olavius sp. associated proteobacterium Delta 1]